MLALAYRSSGFSLAMYPLLEASLQSSVEAVRLCAVRMTVQLFDFSDSRWGL